MGDASERALSRAIASILPSDPLIKLLQQVRLDKIKPTDAGLRAVIEAWMSAYEKALATGGLDGLALRRLDPTPRLAVLIESGALSADHPGVKSLAGLFSGLVARAPVD